MLFNLNKGTNLTTFWSDPTFTAHIGKLFKIPREFYERWQEHYISVEFNSPANLEENVTIREYIQHKPAITN